MTIGGVISESGSQGLTIVGIGLNDVTSTSVLTSTSSNPQATYVALTGANTYTGVTTINKGVLSVTNLQNGLMASSIGASSSLAGNLVFTNNGVLQYAGTTAPAATDRGFTVNGSGVLDASGTTGNTLTLSGTAVFTGPSSTLLTLAGSNTGANTLASAIGDGANGSTTLVKNGVGTWVLPGTNANTYTGGTVVNQGVLQFGAGTAIGGSGANVTVNNLGVVALDYNFGQTDLARIATVSTGVVALANTNVTHDLDFSAAAANLANASLGATGTATYSGTLTPNGQTYLLGGGGGTLTVSSVLGDVNATATALVVGQVGSSSTAFSNAFGTVSLTNANTYSGGTTINGGTLQGTVQTSGSPFGSTTAGMTINNGTLQLNAITSGNPTGATIGALATGGGANVTINWQSGNDTTTLTAASLARTGKGTVVFNPGGGTLNTNSIFNFTTAPTPSNGMIAPWAVLQTGSGATAAGDFLNVASGNLTTAAYTTLTTAGGGTANTTIFQTTGSVALTAAVTGQALNVGSGNAVTGTAARTITIGNSTTLAGGVILNAGSSIGGANAVTLAFGTSEGLIYTAQTATLSTLFTGTNGMTFFGPGTVTLSPTGNTSSLTGQVTVSGGTTVKLGNNNIFSANTATIAVLDGGTLDLSSTSAQKNNVTIQGNGVNGQGALINSGASQINALQQTLTLSGDASIGGVGRFDVRSVTLTSTTSALNLGGFTLTKIGSNYVGLVSANVTTGSGNIVIDGGMLGLQIKTTVSGAGTITVNSGGVLEFLGNASGSPSVTKNITFAGGSVLFENNFANSIGGGTALTTLNAPNTNFVMNQAATTNTWNSVIGETGGVRAVTVNMVGTQAATLVFNQANTYSGVTTVNTGATLSVTNLQDGGTASSVGQSSNAAGSLVLNGGTLQLNASATAGQTDRLFTFSANSVLDGSGATVALNFTNTGSLVAAGTVPATLTLAGNSTHANTLTPVIADNGALATTLIKSGAGEWILAGANTYTGGTTITAGFLVAGNTTGSATGTGTVTISNTGNLSGGNGNGAPGSANDNTTNAPIVASFGGTASNATLTSTGSTQGIVNGGGTITVSSTGTVAPGTPTTLGILTVGSNTTFQNSSSLTVKLTSTGNDVLVLTAGNLAFGQSGSDTVKLNLSLLSPAGFTLYQTVWYTVAQVNGGGTVTDPATLQIVQTFDQQSAFQVALDPSSTQLRIGYTPTPEPSQLLLLGVLGAGAGFYWRRRRCSC